jgi:ribosomal-protein-alanine N-acetyltransferase
MYIETSRLVIREYCQDDWQAVHEYASLPQVAQFMRWGPNDESQTKEFIRIAILHQVKHARNNFDMAVQLKENAKVIGGVVVRVDNQTADLGYCFNPSIWGFGYATEAVRAMINFGFNKLSLHRIYATCAPENVASQAVMKRNGMRQEAHYRQSLLIKREWCDNLLFALLDSEWQQIPCDQRQQITIAGN